ncbi:hypothetical protein C2S53_016438 [Perilla frutescens var. hirtella]|uniref:Uncharacterized protein n=1 Tax=Perilla frutescens var. hirtella TaxID=608512 RepID=A0AAD4P6T4_PERFH|nr:hypothetical protein C2S53_016438 [Perilla frutescens var. hirtella]
MAKDVRKFVQNFNMSRQLSDHKQSLYNHDSQQIVESPKVEQQKRKRNDWTEYIDDDQEEYCRKFEEERKFAPGDGGVEFEPIVMTEMPEAMFVKPKVKDCSSKRYGTGNLLKPSFPNRREGKTYHSLHSQDITCLERDSNRNYTKRAEDNCSQASKWNSFMAQIRGNCSSAKDENYSNGEHQKIAGKKVSKWSSFITEEESDGDDLENWKRRDDDHLLELSMNDERVEEDIHPDFL